MLRNPEKDCRRELQDERQTISAKRILLSRRGPRCTRKPAGEAAVSCCGRVEVPNGRMSVKEGAARSLAQAGPDNRRSAGVLRGRVLVAEQMKSR
jgi:hypothetical protein